jgi:SAM-dependent methyltransferase
MYHIIREIPSAIPTQPKLKELGTRTKMVKSEIYTLNNQGAGARAEENRLNFQHNVFLRMTKGHYLPAHIEEALPPNPRIADVATGTGTWLKALSERLPNARLEGFDMTPEHYPAAETLPSNVTLHNFSQNVLETFPVEFQGQFDVVHVRLLMFGLKVDEWDEAFRNVAALLRPGGWLHWEETGYTSWVSIPPSRAMYDLLAFDIEWARRSGRDVTTPVRLLRHVVNAGLVDYDEHDYSGFELSEGHDDEVNEIMFRVMSQAVFGIVTKGGMEGLKTKEDAQRLVDELKKDRDRPGQAIGLDMKWVWGRKPL